MNIEEQLLTINSTKNWEIIIDHVIKHPEKMQDLMDLYFHKEYHQYNRASQVVGHLWEKRKDLVEPYLIQMANYLDTNPPTAPKRSIMRLYQWADIDEEVEGKLFDYALKFIVSIDEPLAVKAYSMTVARRICEKYPELINELLPLLEDFVAEAPSTGTWNRAKMEIKKINKLLKANDLQ